MTTRDEMITLHLTKQDKDFIEQKAKDAGLSVSKYLVSCGLTNPEYWSSREAASNTVRKLRGRYEYQNGLMQLGPCLLGKMGHGHFCLRTCSRAFGPFTCWSRAQNNPSWDRVSITCCEMSCPPWRANSRRMK